ncbi:hypothetical protein JX266_003077 [Neoarthrinium moseri]|uniref:uncharacterized protein n=1 Tax=Neoarthrinium moseri TaxID=1658444 RepID=UPI001FDE0B95|nr:uncharacterized protein JN550_007213 [Neoarthrinium moseri]KAI1851615.1 hypothetical protein JX266_003077 [Neoarthrinium moseri]KAI1867161.1 hypothetical protein JN550_007213 [Neoarthrinium moseri]
MCNNIYTHFEECNHRYFQNTSHCHVARRCKPADDMLLESPVFLPQLPKIPPGLLDCKQRTLIAPKKGRCPNCEKAEVRQRAEARKKAHDARDQRSDIESSGALVSKIDHKDQSPSGEGPCGTIREETPSPDVDALKAVQKSLNRLSMQQRLTPER